MITRNKARCLGSGPGPRKPRARLLATLMAVVFAVFAFALTGCDAASVDDITSVDTATLQSYLDKLGGKDPRSLTAAEVNNLGSTLGIDKVGDQTVAELARASVFYNVNAINNIDMVVPDDQTFEYTVTLKQSGKELTGSYPIVITDSNNQIKSVGMYTSGDVITVSPNDRIAILGIGNQTYTLFQTSHKLANWTYRSLAYTTVASTNTSSVLGGFKVNETAVYSQNGMSANDVLTGTNKSTTSELPVLQTTTDYSTGLTKNVPSWYRVTRVSNYYNTKKGYWDVNTWSTLNRSSSTTTKTSNTSTQVAMAGSLTIRDEGTYVYKITNRNSKVKGVQYSKAEYLVTIVSERDENGQLHSTVTTVMTKDDAGIACNEVVTDNICLFTNGYDPTQTSYNISGVKDYTDNTGATTSYDESFKFTLTPTNDAAKTSIPADVQNADGSVNVTNDGDLIELPELTFSGFTTKTQTFTYELREVDEGVKGMTYDGTYYVITVTASYTANEGYSVDSIKVQTYSAAGKLTTTVADITTEGYDGDPFTFTNTYDVTDDMLAKDTVSFKKQLKGGTADAGAYTFTVTAADSATENALADGNITGTDVTTTTEGSGDEAYTYGTVADIATASAIADGETIDVSGNELSFNKPGTYTFYVNENGGDDADTTYDSHKATVTFTVTKSADGLSVVKNVDNDTFVNTIGDVEETIEPASSTVTVPKHADGAEHTYTATDSDGKALDVTLDADGNPTVTTEYDAAGTYTYTIADEAGNTVTVTIVVTADPTTGELSATSSFSPEEGFAAYDEPKSVDESVTIAKRADGEDHTYTALEGDEAVEVTTDE
jgi:pilin isopeptide linkage protein